VTLLGLLRSGEPVLTTTGELAPVPRTLEVLEDLPAYYARDPYSLVVLDVLCRELARVEAALEAVREGFAPQLATDESGTLPMWEFQVGASVSPPGATLEERRAAVLARLRKRQSPHESDWIEAMNVVVGSTAWTYYYDGYVVQVRVPAAAGSFRAGLIDAFAQQVTPAHLRVVVGFDEGFLVNVSKVGDPL
jgi:hypothetical protein